MSYKVVCLLLQLQFLYSAQERWGKWVWLGCRRPSEEFSFNFQGNIQATMCQVVVDGNKILLVYMYRPPNFTEEYSGNIRQTLLSANSSNIKQVLICEDFNLKEIDWENHYV